MQGQFITMTHQHFLSTLSCEILEPCDFRAIIIIIMISYLLFSIPSRFAAGVRMAPKDSSPEKSHTRVP